MSRHRVRNTILDLLIRIEGDSGYSHLLIKHEIESRNISLKDEGLLTEIVYGTTERKLTLDYYLDPFITTNKKLELWVRMLLRMSVYQMVYLDRVPDHAIIHEAVEIAKEKGHQGIGSFVNGVLRSIQRKGIPNTADIKDCEDRLSIETSHPKWLVNRWTSQYGKEITQKMCEANLTKSPMTIRIQPLKISRNEAIAQLIDEGYI